MQKLLLFFVGCFIVSFFSSAQAITPKQWTFLIFINGNNNLDRFGKVNIKQMEEVGSTDKINVVVQWASLSTKTTKRLYIEKSTNPTEVTSPVIEELGVVDMGNFQTLKDFIRWGVNKYPAEHYFIDVWDHGSGWHFSKTLGAHSFRKPLNDISFDELSGNHITTEQLGQVMTDAAQVIGHKIDIYGSDACLMSMAEVANEMSSSVHYFLGSQEVEPGAGWPYADFLRRWSESVTQSPEEVSKMLVNAYVKSYLDEGTWQVTFSALDLSKLESLDVSLKALASEIRNLSSSDRLSVLNIGRRTQAFYYSDYKDILDFVKRLQVAQIKGLSAEALENVQKNALAWVLSNEGTKRYANATGASLWFPTNAGQFKQRIERYHGLKFDANTAWGETLNTIVPGSDS